MELGSWNQFQFGLQRKQFTIVRKKIFTLKIYKKSKVVEFWNWSKLVRLYFLLKKYPIFFEYISQLQ